MVFLVLSHCLADQLRLQVGIFVISALEELVVLEKRAARILVFGNFLLRVEDKQSNLDAGLLPSFDLSNLLKHELPEQHLVSA